MEQSFIAYIENSIKENWDLDALTDYKGATLQYKDVARKIEKLHIIFEASGIRKGEKIAVCGRNSSHWGVTFLATLTYGAVIVPILHEFKATMCITSSTTPRPSFFLSATRCGKISTKAPCRCSKVSS